MLKANKAAARLQAQWDATVDEPRTIEKIVGTPKSGGAVGWTWAAIAPDGTWDDLGYTELNAKYKIKTWNSKLSVAMRKLNESMAELEKSL